MSVLLDLPNELLQGVFSACPEISSAFHLGAANKRLRAILVDNIDIIVSDLLVNNGTPGSDEAIKLARMETANRDDPLSWIPQLALNAKLCEAVCESIEEGQSTYFKLPPPSHPYMAQCYYVLRQLVFSQEHNAEDHANILASLRAREPQWVHLLVNLDMCVTIPLVMRTVSLFVVIGPHGWWTQHLDEKKQMWRKMQGGIAALATWNNGRLGLVNERYARIQ